MEKTIIRCKEPKNKAELEFYNFITKKGWVLQRRGWPDFFCYNPNTNKFMLVEVKRKRGHNLKNSQLTVMRMLSTLGVECYRWDPEEGFMKISAPVNTP